MRRLSFRTVLIAIAAGFFLLGIFSTFFRPGSPQAAATLSPLSGAPTRATSSPAPDGDQTTVLILGVDSLAEKNPTLLAAWMASFRPPERDVFVLGVPVDWPSPDGSTLRKVYESTRARGPDFDAALSAVTPLPIDIVVVLDSQGFSEVIDFLGGVPGSGEPTGGAAALNILDLLRADPQASLRAQYRLLQALAERAGRIEPGADLQPLLSLIPDHASINIPETEAIARVAPILPLDPARIHIGLPGEPPAESAP